MPRLLCCFLKLLYTYLCSLFKLNELLLSLKKKKLIYEACTKNTQIKSWSDAVHYKVIDCIFTLFQQPTRLQWQKVFYITAGMYVLGWATFLLLGSGKQQSWNTPYEDRLVPIDIPREPRKPVMADILSINNSEGQVTDSSHSAAEC